MSAAVVLDSTPLGIICHPRTPRHALACRQWLDDLVHAGRRVLIPEIADFKVRRELLRRNSLVALGLLDQYEAQLEYLPITTDAMRHAASLWAQARHQGQPTAPDLALDADVILAAQALTQTSPLWSRRAIPPIWRGSCQPSFGRTSCHSL